jgi:hypothetical protein
MVDYYCWLEQKQNLPKGQQSIRLLQSMQHNNAYCNNKKRKSVVWSEMLFVFFFKMLDLTNNRVPGKIVIVLDAGDANDYVLRDSTVFYHCPEIEAGVVVNLLWMIEMVQWV